MAGGGVSYGVSSAYDQIVETLADVSINANIGFIEWTRPLAGRFIVDSANPDLAHFTAHLHFNQWVARGQLLSILLHVRETIMRDGGALLKSNVHLDYFAIDGTDAVHQHSVHFDFGGAEPNHPTFHGQICPDIFAVPRAVLDQLDFKYNVAPSHARCFRESRFPTADMTLPSVLLSIAADHIHGQFFMDFLNYMREHQNGFPLPACVDTRNGIQNSANMRSCHWFAHMV